MIVSSMNSKEIISEYFKDYDIVSRKARFISKKVRREALRKGDKKYTYITDYKSKLKNDWLIFIDYNNGEPLILTAVYYLNRNKMNVVVIQSDNKTFIHYTSHFLERYNERFINQADLSKLELLKQFLPLNNFASYDVIDRKSVV